ncbi:hypothetical protein H310_03421 [Aphanomyces invadans]|uniref:Endonuclease/exonuclease/phosphatase domain-containing protein n=1 Tax=Aphanomyces invadans TaxID=157072 RepID=A0A024UJA6_9STRA|nr:hypothetical protein H310_03421 [Aphanomyces invadans]ETW05713.1 hypothetical protein H310_03421 [Aphanomyces invadans]|eukprot:XP_008865490.1 hypothetical protein H310_03421 [Aphanomyces invadans]
MGVVRSAAQHFHRSMSNMSTPVMPIVPSIVKAAVHPSAASSFSIAQLNILASNLAKPDRFPYVQPTVLEWTTRKEILVRQLTSLQADVLCLEELSDYWTYFRPTFLELGYDSVYVKRPSGHVSEWSGQKKLDGCGLFFRQSKFSLKEVESVNFSDEHDRVALLVLLEEIATSELVLVGTTHLWWNSAKVDHQLKQLIELNREMNDMADAIHAKYRLPAGHTVPVVVCGDFNNSPSSLLYRYMENSFLRPKCSMKSAYANYCIGDGSASSAEQVESGGNEPPHTTVNFRRCWTIDYIWFSSEHLRPDSVLEIPSEEALRSEDGPEGWQASLPSNAATNQNGIPNSVHGSDHVPLLATFSFT